MNVALFLVFHGLSSLCGAAGGGDDGSRRSYRRPMDESNFSTRDLEGLEILIAYSGLVGR
jgi:hypothetical protein